MLLLCKVKVVDGDKKWNHRDTGLSRAPSSVWMEIWDLSCLHAYQRWAWSRSQYPLTWLGFIQQRTVYLIIFHVKENILTQQMLIATPAKFDQFSLLWNKVFTATGTIRQHRTNKVYEHSESNLVTLRQNITFHFSSSHRTDRSLIHVCSLCN